ncbi:MAG: CHAT domain-containing protein [Bacteroidia bacterium]|nr:CHAT domain-containing protein [Bacteroidia bacterium]
MDKIRRGYSTPEHKTLVAEGFFNLYEQALANALVLRTRQTNPATVDTEIFYLFEKSRSALLREATQVNQAELLLPNHLLNQKRVLLGAIYLLRNKIYDETDETQKAHYLGKLSTTEKAYEDFLQTLKKNYPSYYASNYAAEVVGLAEVQQEKLPAHTLVLGYLYGEDAIYGLGISQQSFIIRQIPLSSGFEARLKEFLNYIRNGESTGELSDYNQYNTSAHYFYRKLVAPLLPDSGQAIEKMVVIPDGLLSYLPFEILHTQAASTSPKVDYIKLPYLFRQFATRYEYSATLLFDKPAAALASTSTDNYLGFAPIYEDDNFLGAQRSFQEEFPNTRRRSGELRYNREEVENSSQLFDGQSFIGEEATKANFLRHAESCQGILHLSMHGLVNDTLPDRSCLVFGKTPASQKRGRRSSPGDSPLLHAYELYHLKIPAEMVILSACETGTGKFSRGEGILSLGRAFKLAGCKNVVMSFWPVDDQSTSQLMQRFLNNLAQGMNKDVALQQARLKYLEEEGQSHQLSPHYWAAFVLVGDDLPLSRQAQIPLYFYGIATLLIGAGTWGLWRKYSR